MDAYDSFLDRIAAWIAKRLQKESSGYKPYTPSDQQTLLACLVPGDILLIEGNQKLSAGIKYLTQSTWSHAAMYIGDALAKDDESEPPRLIEVILGEGCIAVPLSKYETFNTRICRASGLDDDDRRALTDFMIGNLGVKYDLHNIFDLARYLLPTPPVPVRWAPPHAVAGFRRADTGHLFDADCPGLSVDLLSDPARGDAGARGGPRQNRVSRAGKSCTSATTRCSHRATLTCRPISGSSNRRLKKDLTTGR